jgi:hypothetical protein
MDRIGNAPPKMAQATSDNVRYVMLMTKKAGFSGAKLHATPDPKFLRHATQPEKSSGVNVSGHSLQSCRPPKQMAKPIGGSSIRLTQAFSQVAAQTVH